MVKDLKQIGIFGGTFDPIHIGHIYIAKKSVEILNLEKLIFVPGGNPPHKTEKIVTPSEIRYELIKIAINGEEKFDISEVEINSSKLSYTYETLEYFKNIYSDDYEINFITGTDCLMDLRKWKNFQEILRLCNFVVLKRNGYNEEDVISEKENLESEYNGKVVFLDINPMNISSSEIREKIKNNIDCKDLLPFGVYTRINELGLYK